MQVKKKAKFNNIIVAYAFLLPSLIMIGAFIIYPTIKTFIMSFYNWNGFSKKLPEFVGVKNYIKLFGTSGFINALKNNLIYTFFIVIITVILGLVLATPIDRQIKGWKVFKFSFYIPAMISITVTGVLWKLLLDGNIGMVNAFLKLIGLEKLTRTWLSDPNIVMGVLIFVAAWQCTGTTMILFLAAMSSISKDVHEAATLDGVNEIQRFYHITFPMIKRPFLVVVMLQIINGFKTYDIFAVMTEGGPGTTTQVLSLYLTKIAFEDGKYGLACAIAVVMIVFVAIISIIYITQSRLGDQVIE